MGGVASLLHGEGARGAGADRGGHRPHRRFRARRGVRAGRRPLRRGGTGAAHRRDHGDQRMEPVRGGDPDDARALHPGAARVTARTTRLGTGVRAVPEPTGTVTAPTAGRRIPEGGIAW